MAITYPNSGSSEQGSAALTFPYTLLFTPTAGRNLYVFVVGNEHAAGTTYSVADNTGGGNYTQDKLIKSASFGQTIGWYRRDNIPSGVTVVTITCSVSTFLSIGVAEAAGALSAASIDVISAGAENNTTSATPGSYTPTTGDAALTGMTHGGSVNQALSTATSGWSVLTKQESTTGMPLCVLQNLNSSGAQNPVTTLGTGAGWNDVGVSYKVAATNNPPPRGLLVRPSPRHYADAWG